MEASMKMVEEAVLDVMRHLRLEGNLEIDLSSLIAARLKENKWKWGFTEQEADKVLAPRLSALIGEPVTIEAGYYDEGVAFSVLISPEQD